MSKILPEHVFSIQTAKEFQTTALEIFQYQAIHIPTYRKYIQHLGISPFEIKRLEDIPFLPISFFKSQTIIEEGSENATIFTSSGTTGNLTSKHYVNDLSIYERSYLKSFELMYGPASDYCILALLPSYLEREGSSLIYMLKDLIEKSEHPKSGFYLHDFEKLKSTIQEVSPLRKILLIGVTYALLDFAEEFPFKMNNTIIMETGGMKGQRKELMRTEVHLKLKEAFQVEKIHSEYGMTELLSQAYSIGDGIFICPPWMKIEIREINDPLTSIKQFGKTGGINIIDLANIHSCSFISTQDLGKKISDETFEILGRFDNSDTRGCNLLVS